MMVAAMVMDRSAAVLRARDDHIGAARAQQLDRLSIHPLEHHASDATGEKRDRSFRLSPTLRPRPEGRLSARRDSLG